MRAEVGLGAMVNQVSTQQARALPPCYMAEIASAMANGKAGCSLFERATRTGLLETAASGELRAY